MVANTGDDSTKRKQVALRAGEGQSVTKKGKKAGGHGRLRTESVLVREMPPSDRHRINRSLLKVAGADGGGNSESLPGGGQGAAHLRVRKTGLLGGIGRKGDSRRRFLGRAKKGRHPRQDDDREP